jgi:hypothetical protein
MPSLSLVSTDQICRGVDTGHVGLPAGEDDVVEPRSGRFQIGTLRAVAHHDEQRVRAGPEELSGQVDEACSTLDRRQAPDEHDDNDSSVA